ncbi:MAG: type IV pilus twitching motility protein PilT [Acidobacteriota bacterium]
MAAIDLDTLLGDAVARGASDLHLKVDSPPFLRIDGVLRAMEGHSPLTAADTRAVAERVLDDHHLSVDEVKEVDASYAVYALGRFRCNVFTERGVLGAVLRVIPGQTRTIADLNLPPVIEDIALSERGLVLATGTTGSGKSTTLAAILDHINKNRARHIVTIEDPIEFLHTGGRCLVTQRELGQDTHSYSDALRAALRQDPDIILVGEMRDKETIETALVAAETGHLVLSTLHTLDAPETINRVIAVFPPYQQNQIRAQLAEVLRAVVSMRLVRHRDGDGRVPACEIMLSTTFIRECIRDRERVTEIRDAIAQGVSQYGMQTFDQSLLWLHKKDLITVDEALAAASNPNDMKLQLRGIISSAEAVDQTMEIARKQVREQE